MKGDSRRRRKDPVIPKIRKIDLVDQRLRRDRRQYYIFSVVLVALLGFLFMATTGMLSGLFTQFMVQAYPKSVFCSQSDFTVQKANYDLAGEELTLYIYNRGSVPLYGFAVRIEYDDGSEKTKEFGDLRVGGNDIELAVLGSSGNIELITVRSLECGDVRDILERDEINGLD